MAGPAARATPTVPPAAPSSTAAARRRTSLPRRMFKGFGARTESPVTRLRTSQPGCASTPGDGCARRRLGARTARRSDRSHGSPSWARLGTRGSRTWPTRPRRCPALVSSSTVALFIARYDLRRPTLAETPRHELYAAALEQAAYCDEKGFDTVVL